MCGKQEPCHFERAERREIFAGCYFIDTWRISPATRWACGPVHLISALRYNGKRYILQNMIRSFRDKEAKKLFERIPSLRIPHDINRMAFRRLRMLHRAFSLEDLRIPPGNRLEQLEGVRKRQYSIRINDQWRICFVWRDGNAYDVEIVDYHK